jgi:nucleotide-binding universal stress UspA family protein
MRPYKRILCPVDFSECSSAALEEAASLAKVIGAELTLLHAYQNPAYVLPMQGYVGFSGDFLTKLREQLDGEIAKQAVPLRDQGIAVKTELIEGVPYKAIVDHAKENRSDLIVMGTHGRTGLAHALTGSVAERVVRLAHCPVLVTRGPQQQAA